MINEKQPESEDSDSESICLESNLESVRLKSGLNLRDVGTEAGAIFETQAFENEPDIDDLEGDGVHVEAAFKYTKKELSGGGSVEDTILSPFAKIARHMIDISPKKDQSLLKQVLKPGFGAVVEPKSRVAIHYNAYFEYQPDPYDSTYLRNKKLTFRLGEGETISGLDFSVSTMSVHEKSHFLMKPEWGYGKHGCPPRIPKNATLYFEVVLEKILIDTGAVEFDKLSIAEQNAVTFAQTMKIAKEEHKSGNKFLKEARHGNASSCYHKAVRLLENTTFSNEIEENEAKKLLLMLYQNQCLLFDRMGHFRKVKRPAHEALRIKPNNAKALFRLGRAHGHFGEWAQARRLLFQAQRLEPKDPVIRAEIINLDKRQADFKAAEKSCCLKMLSQSVNLDENNPDKSPEES